MVRQTKLSIHPTFSPTSRRNPPISAFRKGATVRCDLFRSDRGNVWGDSRIHIDRNIHHMVQPATSKSLGEAAEHKGSGRFFDFGQGENPIPPPVRLFTLYSRLLLDKRGYALAAGEKACREAVARYEREVHGIDRGGENILFGPGGRPLLNAAIQCMDHPLVCPTPSWVSYWQLMRGYGRQFEALHLRDENGFALDGDHLEYLLQSKLPPRSRWMNWLSRQPHFASRFGNPFHKSPILVVTHPENPQGGSMHPLDLRRIAEVAYMYDLIVMADEIYDELVYPISIEQDQQMVSVNPYLSFAHRTIYPSKTIRMTGLSKNWGWPGARFCWLSVPDDLMDLKTKLIQDYSGNVFGGTNHALQWALAEMLNNHRAELADHFAHNRRILQRVGYYTWDYLRNVSIQEMPLGNLIVGEPPQAGLYKWIFIIRETKEKLNAKGIKTSVQLAQRLRDEYGVRVLEGEKFGRPPEELSFRIVFAKGLDNGPLALHESEEIGLGEGSELPKDFIDRNATTLKTGLECLVEGIKGLAS